MNHKIFRLISSLFLALAVTAVASGPQPARAAGPWYVAPGGNNSNTCLSPSTPCATINGALAKPGFIPGDTVQVAIGIYTSPGYETVLIDKDVTLSGGWNSSFTSQTGFSTFDGQNLHMLFAVARGVNSSFDHLILQNAQNFAPQAGAIYNFGTLRITNSIIQNSVAGYGGGIYNEGSLTLYNTTVRNNSSSAQAGEGAGIYNLGSLILNNSTVSGNTSLPGYSSWAISNSIGTAILNNSTVSGNTGGISSDNNGLVILNNSTVSNNIVENGWGGGIVSVGGIVYLHNTLLANNFTGSGTAPDCYGTINSQGFNLIGNPDGCTIVGDTTGNLLGFDPLLGPLQNNGGPTLTHALLALSPAIDAGDPAGCTDNDGNLITTDQRGFNRPEGTRCDIGAYEYTDITTGPAISLAILSGDGQRSYLNTAFSNPLRVVAFDDQGNRVSGVTVTFTAPASGASGTFADTGTNTTIVDTDAGGAATTSVFTANDQAGTYTVTASATGLVSVNFSIEQVIRPANDNFADAIAITSLPFSDSLDNKGATTESSEPQPCYNSPNSYKSPNTVWYSFTPTTNVLASVDMAASSFGDFIVNVYKDEGLGMNSLRFIGCGYSGNLVILTFEAGVTYYIQAGSIDSGGGDLQIDLQEIYPPTNDNFASASPISSIPATIDFTNLAATTESGEPALSCDVSSPPAQSTVWFSFTATQDEYIAAGISNFTFSAVWGVYSGTNLNDLTEVGCDYLDNLIWHALAGQTYYIQVSAFNGSTGTGTLSLIITDPPPPPLPYFNYGQFIPSTLEIQFSDHSDDPAGIGIETWEWDFGDGTLHSTYQYPTHTYAADGDYNVTLTVTTFDGRSASFTRIVQVRTPETLVVEIDIKPGNKHNRIMIASRGSASVQVAILSTADFDAPAQVDKNSLTFGATGDEDSLRRRFLIGTPDCRARDVNRDRIKDLVCSFLIGKTSFKVGDTIGILKGQTVDGSFLEGRDLVQITAPSYPSYPSYP